MQRKREREIFTNDLSVCFGVFVATFVLLSLAVYIYDHSMWGMGMVYSGPLRHYINIMMIIGVFVLCPAITQKTHTIRSIKHPNHMQCMI